MSELAKRLLIMSTAFAITSVATHKAFAIYYEHMTPTCPLTIEEIHFTCKPNLYQQFDSRGGYINHGLNILNYGIHYAHAIDQCSSMCIPMLITALRRTACSHTIFKFHKAGQVSRETGEYLGESVYSNQIIVSLVSTDKRIDSARFYEWWHSAEYTSFTEKTAYDLLEYGMLDEIIECNKE